MVAPKAVVRDPLRLMSVTQGPGPSLLLLGMVGIPNAATVLEVWLTFRIVVETLVVTRVSIY